MISERKNRLRGKKGAHQWARHHNHGCNMHVKVQVRNSHGLRCWDPSYWSLWVSSRVYRWRLFPRFINELFNHSWQPRCSHGSQERSECAHFFLEITLTFFLMARDLFLRAIITWKRWRSVRLARVSLLASFLAIGIFDHLSARPAALAALMRVPVRAPRWIGIFILVKDNLFSGKIILGKSSASTSTRFSSAMSTMVTIFP